jgi:HK97 family phage portal protein
MNRSPVSYSPRVGSRFGQQLQGNPTQALNAMGSVGTLFSIVSRISQDVAAAEWCLYRKNTDARRAYATTPRPRQEITRHPALEVWNRPNPFMTHQAFVEITAQHQELVGEQYWLPGWDDTFPFPTELWPIRPDKMQEVPSPTDFLSGWIYNGPDGNRVPLEADEVIQLKSPNPMNIYRGMGAVQSILMDIDSTKYSAEWNRNFFINGAQPGGVIEIPTSLSDPEFNQFNARWRESHQGVAAAHRVAMLENGMKWVDVNFTQKDMQFAELRTVSREIIREAFGISKTMLGQTEDVNRATAEAAKAVYAEHIEVPRLDRIKDALNTSFLPLFGPLGEGIEFDYISPVPEDHERESTERTSKVGAISAMIALGFDPQEVLELNGFPPITFTKKEVPTFAPPKSDDDADPEDPVDE